MKFRTLAVSAAALAVIGFSSACVPDTAEPVAAPMPTQGLGLTTAPVATQAPAVRNPLTADGDFRVGTAPGQIPPGMYTATTPDGHGYFEVCADVKCSIGSGMLSNEFITGDAEVFVEIPATAMFVKAKSDIVLTPQAGA